MKKKIVVIDFSVDNFSCRIKQWMCFVILDRFSSNERVM